MRTILYTQKPLLHTFTIWLKNQREEKNRVVETRHEFRNLGDDGKLSTCVRTVQLLTGFCFREVCSLHRSLCICQRLKRRPCTPQQLFTLDMSVILVQIMK
jgi:hypothetical protein